MCQPNLFGISVKYILCSFHIFFRLICLQIFARDICPLCPSQLPNPIVLHIEFLMNQLVTPRRVVVKRIAQLIFYNEVQCKQLIANIDQLSTHGFMQPSFWTLHIFRTFSGITHCGYYDAKYFVTNLVYTLCTLLLSQTCWMRDGFLKSF